MIEERLIKEQPKPEIIKPADPALQPHLPELTESMDHESNIIISMDTTVTLDPIGTDIGLSTGSAVPIFKVAPRYPHRAITRGIEGYVDLIFDISATGKTENIRVIYAQPKGYFESASRKTLEKWKYKPAVEEGVAKPQKNQTTRISYTLEQ